ncbi:MAG: hypothetical protein AAF602_31120 [Myxococcota bacterium]
MGSTGYVELPGGDFESLEILAIHPEGTVAAFRRFASAARGNGLSGDLCDYPGVEPDRGSSSACSTSATGW